MVRRSNAEMKILLFSRRTCSHVANENVPRARNDGFSPLGGSHLGDGRSATGSSHGFYSERMASRGRAFSALRVSKKKKKVSQRDGKKNDGATAPRSS